MLCFALNCRQNSVGSSSTGAWNSFHASHRTTGRRLPVLPSAVQILHSCIVHSSGNMHQSSSRTSNRFPARYRRLLPPTVHTPPARSLLLWWCILPRQPSSLPLEIMWWSSLLHSTLCNSRCWPSNSCTGSLATTFSFSLHMPDHPFLCCARGTPLLVLYLCKRGCARVGEPSGFSRTCMHASRLLPLWPVKFTPSIPVHTGTPPLSTSFIPHSSSLESLPPAGRCHRHLPSVYRMHDVFPASPTCRRRNLPPAAYVGPSRCASGPPPSSSAIGSYAKGGLTYQSG